MLFCFETKASDLWLKDIPVNKLQKLYISAGYDGPRGYLLLKTRTYPRIFLKNFPPDFNSITDEKEKASLFIKILAPMVLKTNEDIFAERQTLINIRNKFAQNSKLNQKDIQTLEALAEKYDVFTRLKDDERTQYLTEELFTKIDIIPASILITAAALQTNWGTSRIVEEANSLYKTLNWYSEEGLKPIGEKEDNSYRIKTYPDIYRSIQEFALNLNSNVDFRSFRDFRLSHRKINPILTGTMLSPYVFLISNLQNYAGIFDYTLMYYELLEIDKSKLDDKIISEKISKGYSEYITPN